jgi:NAD+ dependent glucose-6-phosphate dehydrogenase
MDKPVLMTGASGRVGQAILQHAGETFNWRLVDREPVPRDRRPDHIADENIIIADIRDSEAVTAAVEGCQAVIHLAGDPRPEAPWNSVVENNINGTHSMYEAAVEANIEKFIFASSNHAVGAYETEERTPDMYRPKDQYRLTGAELPRPTNHYGVSKATGEIIGRYYHDHHDISVVNVRIGNLTKGHPPIDYERGQAMWLSYRDCAHLFTRCVQAEYEFEIVYGISDNDRKYYSIERARTALGYNPQDNSAEWRGAEQYPD